jgi:16S rRNA (cytosine967-C5)-methyltransferase
VTEAARGATVRAVAAETIAAVRFEGVSLKARLPHALQRLADPRDRGLCEAICFEACRWTLRYEWLLPRLMPRPLPRSLRAIHALLLAGLAQLDAMALPDYAALSSTAEAARLLKHPRHVGLVNAVLRRFLREREPLQAAQQSDALAQHAHPAWFAAALQRDWGALATQILEQGNRIAPTWLRVNLRRGDVASYRVALQEAGLEPTTSALLPEALRLEQGVPVERLPGWSDARVSIQDLSAQLAAVALEASDGERVLDACAPSELLALDQDPVRLERVRATLARLGLEARLRQADAAAPETWWDGVAFDRILLDAPCSGSGVIRRQPDIKLHRRGSDVAALCAQQARLLDALWPMLAAGGRLVYATCSVLKDENERQIDAFLARTPDASPVALPDSFGRASGVGRQRMPGDDGGDGFFHAVLERR